MMLFHLKCEQNATISDVAAILLLTDIVEIWQCDEWTPCTLFIRFILYAFWIRCYWFIQKRKSFVCVCVLRDDGPIIGFNRRETKKQAQNLCFYGLWTKYDYMPSFTLTGITLNATTTATFIFIHTFNFSEVRPQFTYEVEMWACVCVCECVCLCMCRWQPFCQVEHVKA